MTRPLFFACLIAAVTVTAAAADRFKHALTGPDHLIEIKRKAEAGDAKSQKDYGDAFNSEFKFAEAEVWYRKAAITGYPDALYELGAMYDGGRSMPNSRVASQPTNSFHLFQLAANQGHRSSHSRLGRAYMQGRIVRRDPIKAYCHFKLAGGGEEPSIKRLILEMSQDQIAEAEAQAKAFKPIPFKTAFETLALDTLQLQSITGPGNQRFAILNGKPCNPSTPLNYPIASLPATFTCTALDQYSITLSIGSSRRTYSLGSQRL